MVDYHGSGEYDQHLDVVEILRPLNQSLDKMKYVWRKMGMGDQNIAPYRLTEGQLDRIDDALVKLRARFEEMEIANRNTRP
jgi:hypothetical protein